MRVKQAEYVKDYKIRILFSDGLEKVVDFTSFLKEAKHVFIPLRELEYFKRFQLGDVTISWPNGADFEPDLLHEMGVKVKKETKKTARKHKGRSFPRSEVGARPPIAAKSRH